MTVKFCGDPPLPVARLTPATGHRVFFCMKKKILLVSEDPAVRRMIFRVLTGEGHNVVTASTDPEALKLALRSDADVLLFDADIQENNTAALVRLAGPENRFPAVILLSDRPEAVPLKVIGAMAKPLDLQRLLEMIELAPGRSKAGLASAA